MSFSGFQGVSKSFQGISGRLCGFPRDFRRFLRLEVVEGPLEVSPEDLGAAQASGDSMGASEEFHSISLCYKVFQQGLRGC